MNRAARVRLLLITAASLAIGGCMAPAFFANLFSAQRNEPVYELQNRKTLVLVDDPGIKLGSAMLASIVSDGVMNQLRDEQVVTDFVDLSRLNDVKVDLGQDYSTTSIDRIGKAVGAEQVVYVLIDDVIRYPQPGVLMPQAKLSVKVLDVQAGKRLFPPTDYDTRPRGHDLSVDLGVKIAAEFETDSKAKMMRLLAERIAREVARLFHSYEPDTLGERSNATQILNF